VAGMIFGSSPSSWWSRSLAAPTWRMGLPAWADPYASPASRPE
jgi:hypothetical protein